MQDDFNPRAVTANEFWNIVLTYLIDPDATTRSLARKFGVGKSTIATYLSMVSVYDKKLHQLIRTKCTHNIQNPTEACYHFEKDTVEILRRAKTRILKRKSIPDNMTSFIWG